VSGREWGLEHQGLTDHLAESGSLSDPTGQRMWHTGHHVNGVPYFVFNAGYALSGAHSPEAIIESIEVGMPRLRNTECHVRFRLGQSMNSHQASASWPSSMFEQDYGAAVPAAFAPSPPMIGSTSRDIQDTATKRLDKLKELLQKGLITQDDYDQKKKETLSHL
jgi:hypothetical protein